MWCSCSCWFKLKYRSVLFSSHLKRWKSTEKIILTHLCIEFVLLICVELCCSLICGVHLNNSSVAKIIQCFIHTEVWLYPRFWLYWVLVASCRLLVCNMWDLVSWLGVEPGLPSLGVQSLSSWTTGEVPWVYLVTIWFSVDFSALATVISLMYQIFLL